MRADDGGIDHLHCVRQSPAFIQSLQHRIPQAGNRPATELSINRGPIAKRTIKVSPRRPSARDPEDRIKNTTMVSRRPPAFTASSHDKGRKERPLAIRHQAAHQDLPSKSSLESRLS